MEEQPDWQQLDNALLVKILQLVHETRITGLRFLAIPIGDNQRLNLYRLVCKRWFKIWCESVKVLRFRDLKWAELDQLVSLCSSQQFSNTAELDLTGRWHNGAEAEGDPDLYVPRWHSIRHLSRLHIGSDGLKLLQQTAADSGSGSMRGRLREVTVWADQEDISSADIMTLSQLKGLASLRLRCGSMTAKAEPLSSLGRHLSALQQLKALRLELRNQVIYSPQQLQYLPGALSSLTGITLLGFQRTDAPGMQAALSALTALQELKTDMPLAAADSVQQLASSLQQLSCLCLEGDSAGSERHSLAALLQHLQGLRVLLLPEARTLGEAEADAIRVHPSLTRLVAGDIQWPGQRAGQVAEDSCLQEVTCKAVRRTGGWPDPFARWPVLPQLQKFDMTYARVPAAGQPGAVSSSRQPGLVCFLQQHRCTLQLVRISYICSVSKGLLVDEPFPADMPLLEDLELKAVGSHTLQSLARCSMPALRKLYLNNTPVVWGSREVVLQDVRWIAELPSLRTLQLLLGAQVMSAQVRQALQGLLRPAVKASIW